MIVYVVQMELVEQKPNKTDPFKYVLGVYTDPEEAKQAGTIEEGWRYGKYKFFLHDYVLDKINDQKAAWALKELMTENLITKDKRLG